MYSMLFLSYYRGTCICIWSREHRFTTYKKEHFFLALVQTIFSYVSVCVGLSYDCVMWRYIFLMTDKLMLCKLFKAGAEILVFF